MQNGLILGVIFSVNFLISTSKVSALILLTYIIATVIVIAIYKFAIRFRDTECEGAISYGRSFLYIILLFFYASLISTVVKYIYFQFINPSYLESMFQDTMKLMEALKFQLKSDELAQTESMFKPLSFSLLYIWSNVIMGGIVALVMAAFIKKEKNIFNQQ